MSNGKDPVTAAQAGGAVTVEETPAPPAAPGPAQGDGPAGRVERPPFIGLVSYVYGGTMPPRYHAWVRRDLTAPGWRWRQALRALLMMVPVAIIFALLPGPVFTRGMLVIFLLVAPFVLGLALAGSFRNRRLLAHGFPALTRGAEDVDDETPAAPAPTAVPGATAAPAARAQGPDDEDPDGVNA